MKTILFARHAESTWENADWTDLSRPLSAKGRQDVALMAQYLYDTQAVIAPQFAVFSPAERTTQTAETYIKALEIAAFAPNERLYEASVPNVWQVVQSLPNDFTHVLLVGHNPSLNNLLYQIGGQEMYREVLPCTVFEVQFVVDNWLEANSDTATVRFFSKVESI